MRYITVVLDPPRRLEDSDEVFDDKAEQLGHDQAALCDQMNDLASDMNDAVQGIADVSQDAADAHAAATAAANAKTAAESARDTATTKASEASTSATAAGNAKTAAESARDTAITKAGEASASATAAGNAKTAAESARDTAITKAGEANASATAAGNAKTAAESARDTATTKAGEASTSATAAGNAKTAAESARDTAVTKAGEASASATSAATSATNAASSAAAAAQSAQDAADAAVGDIFSSSTPQSLGTASAGSAVKASRDDHVHPMPTAANVGAAPAAHVGSGGAAHADATTSASGFMSAAQFNKLAGIAASANNYTHPSGDGNLHVPATGTGNNGKVLKAGSTAGSMAWDTLTASDVGATPAAHVGSGGSAHANATTSVDGFMSAGDKGKLDGVANGATANQTDAYLLNRTNHTGTQAQSTVTNLATDLAGKASAVVVDGSANTFNLASAGNAVPITANSTIPTNASVAYPVGTCIMLQCSTSSRTISGPGANSLTLEGSSTAVTSFTLPANKSVVIRKTAADAWRVYGDV